MSLVSPGYVASVVCARHVSRRRGQSLLDTPRAQETLATEGKAQNSRETFAPAFLALLKGRSNIESAALALSEPYTRIANPMVGVQTVTASASDMREISAYARVCWYREVSRGTPMAQLACG